MKMKNKTLRQLISSINDPLNLTTVYDHLFKKDCDMISHHTPDLEWTTKAYGMVMNELLSKKKARPHQYSIYVSKVDDMGTSEPYIDVCLFNKKGKSPPKGKLPWGGKNYPRKTHYNVNSRTYNQFYAFGNTRWSKIIDAAIINKVKELDDTQLLAEILWELTFNGFTEKECEKFNKILERRLVASLKDINNAKPISFDELKRRLKI